MEVSSIQSHDNVAVSQTSVISFKVADILKLAFCHVAGAAKMTGKGFDSKTPGTSTKCAGPSNQHEGDAEEEKKRTNTYITNRFPSRISLYLHRITDVKCFTFLSWFWS